jgi:hypothetical protein
MIFYAAKSTLPHQTREMTSAVRLLLIVLLGVLAAAGAVACPLSIASCDDHAMPCHQSGNAPDPCPVTVCQASSSYLVPLNSADHELLLQQMPVEVINPGFGRSPTAPHFIPWDDGLLPEASGRVFLRLCSLLI